jgi:predicted 2-oxoglutarate/Fe(II)-dependent dioxygenase YbiX
MPGPEFFERLGLFVASGFLEAPLCAEISSEMQSAAAESGVILRGDGREVDERIRRVLCANPSPDTRRLVEARLESARPQIEKYFGVSLEANPMADFLVYREGGHYALHRDSSTDPNRSNHRRRISVIVFLNGDGAYSGGKLMFQELIKEKDWERCAFPLDAPTGLLIAFPAGLPHEVTPVTAGERCTIVSWFLARDAGGRN